jgi:hypothetical protein
MFLCNYNWDTATDPFGDDGSLCPYFYFDLQSETKAHCFLNMPNSQVCNDLEEIIDIHLL